MAAFRYFLGCQPIFYAEAMVVCEGLILLPNLVTLYLRWSQIQPWLFLGFIPGVLFVGIVLIRCVGCEL